MLRRRRSICSQDTTKFLNDGEAWEFSQKLHSDQLQREEQPQVLVLFRTKLGDK